MIVENLAIALVVGVPVGLLVLWDRAERARVRLAAQVEILGLRLDAARVHQETAEAERDAARAELAALREGIVGLHKLGGLGESLPAPPRLPTPPPLDDDEDAETRVHPRTSLVLRRPS